MSFQTFSEVLQGVIDYCREASHFYTQLTTHIEGDLTILLAEDLSRQQLRQADALQEYHDSAEPKVLHTEFQFARADDLWQAPAHNTDDGKLSLTAIQKIMQSIDNAILEVYQQLEQEQLSPELADILDRMAEQQTTIAKKHAFTTQQLQGL